MTDASANSILNLTQHMSTPDQREQGVYDLPPEFRGKVQELLTFEEIPTQRDMLDRAFKLAALSAVLARPDTKEIMIGGAPFFMTILEGSLFAASFKTVYAFSKREVVESEKDGIVTKNMVFKHIGFVR